MMPEASKRRLERTFAPTLALDDHQNRDVLAVRAAAAPKALPKASTDKAHQEKRSLPSREVTDEMLDDAYVTFILYCNPSIPLDTDTTELRKCFRSPPKSNGKSFNTFTLFKLIRKLEQKEIKTWAQLAIDLGVEPPSFEKGQSAQKVQQYAVRLKRWMHAMHVDAFFEYLLNKAHIYWTHVPSLSELSVEFRDGVAPEEDLALRGLLPETRPKRGRRKAEDKDNDSDTGKSPSQRPRLHSPALSVDFGIARSSVIADTATPATANPGYQETYDNRIIPWSATEGPVPSAVAFRWGRADTTQTPLTAYPQSAITPSTRGQLWTDTNEPRSAITPNKSRSRRRHGPAVSSAWPSNGNSASGKLRGRPPSNRSVTDGPFSTFPANPPSRDLPTISLRDTAPAATPVTGNSEVSHFFPAAVGQATSNPPTQNNKPSRLQLQVPQRQGGSVRLATPPPVVLLNGERETNIQHSSATHSHQAATSMMEYFNFGDQDPSFQHFVSIAFRQNEDTDRTNMDGLERHFISEILAADWYDAGGSSTERCSIAEADKICKQVVRNLRAESSSTEAFLINLSALAGGPLMTRLKIIRHELDSRTDYDCHLKMKFGSIEGDFTIRASVLSDSVTPVEAESTDSEESWKKRYLDLQQQIRVRDKKVVLLKTSVLELLLDSNQFCGV